MAPLPVLVVVSGPMGSGKTTLAHRLAASVGCPAICRDEIKEGMVHTTSGFVARRGDELTMRTLPVFFSLLDLLLRAGVTTVAEAAFQDPVWRRGLAPLLGLARLRIVHCEVPADVAFQRSLRRREENSLRLAHADPGPPDAADHARFHDWLRQAGQLFVGEAGQHLADGGHAVGAQSQYLVQRRPRAGVTRDAGLVRHLVVRQIQRVPGRRHPQDGAFHPGVGGEDEVAQGLDERPLSVDPLMQQFRGQPPGPLDGLGPQPFQDVPGFAVPGRAGWAQD